ncbi:MAG: hypothetical protein M3464_06010 [Chloroflexota bacterium]|nr:hypothetical protein [Chloroflexota bacterium]
MVFHAESNAIDDQAAARASGSAVSPVPEPAPLHPATRTIEEPMTRAPGVMPLTVRQPRVGDVAGLRHLDLLFRLNQPYSLLQPYRALRSGMRAAMPGFRERRPAFVARSGDRLVGFAQFQPDGPDERWCLLAIGTAMGVYESAPVIEALLEHGARSAGLRGVKRLFAKVPRNYPIGEAFRRQVWTSFATETIYSAQPERQPTPEIRLLRPQQPADTWAIHQLSNSTVPKLVQDAEALTSHHWDVKPGKVGRGAIDTSGWLIEDGHLVIGYARITASVRACLIEIIYDHERRDMFAALVDEAIAIARRRSGARVYCAVRGYQAELATALEDRGFQPMIEQDVTIKYTTATVRLPVVEAVPFQLEVGEKIPQRVPTFLQGRSGDGATS